MDRGERGSVVIESLIMMGVSLVVLVMVFNLGMWAVEKSLAHSAADQGVRAGAREGVDHRGACEARVAQVLGNTGPGSGATFSCSATDEQVSAQVYLPLRSWLPGLPDSSTEVSATARVERLPQ